MPDSPTATVTWILFRDKLPERMKAFPSMTEQVLLSDGRRVWAERIYFKGRNYDTGGAVAWAAMPPAPRVPLPAPKR